MDTFTITLFIACILFSGFNMYINMKVTRDAWLKILTLLLGLGGLLCAGYILGVSFMNYCR